MRILLLCSSFNGLTQRAWLELRRAGHEVSVELAVSQDVMAEAVELAKPDLVICPFLKEKVPARVWQGHRTVIIHPGPPGDRGPSSLDWAITDGEPAWGVTALQAVEEMDAGPIWGFRTFTLPAEAPRKSSLYNGPVADAAVELVAEVAARAADPSFTPVPAEYVASPVQGRLRRAMRHADREFSWEEPVERIVRTVRAADGSPGGRTRLLDVPVRVFDVRPGPQLPGRPGTLAGRREGAVLMHAGQGTVWVGQLRMESEGAVKLPAAAALTEAMVAGALPQGLLDDVPERSGFSEITYERRGPVGVVGFDFYNGAMSTEQCRRLTAALRYAVAQDTRVLVVRGGEVFSNGIHLNVIEAARHPETEAWRNINAINAACREIVGCVSQLVVTSIGGNAGAGGVMMGLGADRVVVREGVVLNPHYRTMGLFGSEYWTYVLPRRVGAEQAARLTGRALPVGAAEAVEVGLADRMLAGPRAEFERRVLEYAERLAVDARYEELLGVRRRVRESDERRRPLEAYRAEELAEMSRDMFDDRNGFRAARQAFVHKRKAQATPVHLAAHRELSGASGPGFAVPSHM
ncbi:enoyl-CoA hydratase-related protein [Nonomuraea pusilla]|uniref:Methionyl-tRNA formyltransferase n=1 Tax=Nonomuraea pusilla TaxID=46177 RepID=A0A1H7IR88_9ACTN|nr:enoyl-CoA hydratase-related protein [Nonomuraea pusilla]SEK64227.1 Methionyl-tRNA formyltransferase [Nonomuraea pusilla]